MLEINASGLANLQEMAFDQLYKLFDDNTTSSSLQVFNMCYKENDIYWFYFKFLFVILLNKRNRVPEHLHPLHIAKTWILHNQFETAPLKITVEPSIDARNIQFNSVEMQHWDQFSSFFKKENIFLLREKPRVTTPN